MKTQINNLKDYAELAQASYFYFDLKGCILQENETIVTLNELVSLSYNGNIAGRKEKVGQEYSFIGKGELNGEFGELQARNFSQRYEVQFHQSNTLSGFSATLFYDKEKDKFVVGFRGTEVSFKDLKATWETALDTTQDLVLSLNGNLQSSSLLEFLEQVNKIIKNKHKSIIFVGHSLGGYLAQMALIYCDIKYKDKLSFSPSEVYTFNAPSIYGWNFPNIAINPNTIKIMQDLLGKYTIDVSEKITHIYDNGKIEIIASAQYGASNALGIYTGKNDHSIKPLVNTLYFYSYLLELDANHNKVKDKSFSECIEYLNHFMKNIQIYTETFVLKNNAINNKNFALKNGPLGLLRSSPEKINHFEYFLSLIATIMQETNDILEEVGDNYYTSYKAPTISQTKIIDFILKAHEKEKYILILDKNDFNKYRKDSSFVNNQENLAHKIAIGEFRIFIVVYKDMKCLENINNITKIYGYNSKSYKIKDQNWDEQYLGGVCKISQALYFNGKAKIGII
ncbi:putative lipase [Campylobacter lari RM16712]|uniref:lipase family protein n=1 Tax=Campylobacter lari TaxID=201 RepID=UPI00057DB4C9|nr:Mbeg1-like protein [Campylobacter lari]AJD06358.1 putative lipase [Campylobacter lari RM16712]